MNFLKLKIPKILDWPSNSPDLNPIEKIWAFSKKMVEEKTSSILRKSGTLTKYEFCELIKKSVEECSKNYDLKLIKSMKNRIDDCISLKGERIKY